MIMTANKGTTFGIRHLTVVPHDARQPDDPREEVVKQGPTCYDD
ncbi:MAG: hypothetical protein U5K28_11015 [Halobacteriales archaeon]|nr:hypothetical protein [Halobacteriales archaeon]